MYPQATAHGNILAFTPPGFPQIIQVKFPDKRLAVCGKCKKNYKTREMCRERNGHTGEPWAVHYICITLDDSCLDEEGKYVDKPLTARMVQWQPYCLRDHFGREPDGKTAPVCSGCKKTNRTRSFCRDRHHHRQLPWCTVYVMLSSVDTTDPSTIVAGPSIPVDAPYEDDDEEKKADDPRAARAAKAAAEARAESAKIKVADDCDDINDIPESRTFLATVSTREISIKWVELAEYDPSTMQPETSIHAPPHGSGRSAVNGAPSSSDASSGGQPPLRPPNAQEYYAQLAAMGYTPQQQQTAWQMHQQYYADMNAAGQMHAPGTHAAAHPGSPHHHHQQLQQQQQQQAVASPYAASPYAAQGWGHHPGYNAQHAHHAPATAEPPSPPHPTLNGEGDSSSITAGEAATGELKEKGREHSEDQEEEEEDDDEEEEEEEGPPQDQHHDQHSIDPQAQWHAQMMYHSQLYQQQIQMQHDQGQGLIDGHHHHHHHHPYSHHHHTPHPGDVDDPNPLSGGPNEPTAEDFKNVSVDLHDDDDDDDLHQHHDAKRQRVDSGSEM
mmetsp:Transcript_23624/g.48891  ORF Transcript_23624/g.48891 Transcript_23624/m.48891 type:complete len:554 (+) Transcript_23624:591-2252(+)